MGDANCFKEFYYKGSKCCVIFTHIHLHDRIHDPSLWTSEILSVFSVFYALSWYFNFNICRIQRNWGPENLMKSPEVPTVVKITDGSCTWLHPNTTSLCTCVLSIKVLGLASMTITLALFSAHFPAAGFYLWPAVGLGFLVTAAVTVKIAFDSWNQRLGLTLQHQEQWMAAGPLFEISVEPEGVIAEIHLPHIVSLPGKEGRGEAVGQWECYLMGFVVVLQQMRSMSLGSKSPILRMKEWS